MAKAVEAFNYFNLGFSGRIAKSENGYWYESSNGVTSYPWERISKSRFSHIINNEGYEICQIKYNRLRLPND